MIILTGNSNLEFAKAVAEAAGTELCDVSVGKFSNGETRVDSVTTSLRGKSVYVIHSSGNDINNELMETMCLASAAKSAHARSVCLVTPCYPYARQDKKLAGREPITAQMMAQIYQSIGLTSVITVELHNPSVEGFFHVPVDKLSTEYMFASYIRENLLSDSEEFIIVSPDAGGAKRAEKLARRLKLVPAIIHKQRKRPNEVSQMTLLGDVAGKHAIIVDDMADTCGTLARAAELLRTNGAKSVRAFVTHGILSGGAIDNINSSTIDELYVTDSVNLYDKQELCKKIRVISITDLVADAIVRHNTGRSISEMYDSKYGLNVNVDLVKPSLEKVSVD